MTDKVHVKAYDRNKPKNKKDDWVKESAKKIDKEIKKAAKNIG
jgi:hypothetical protein